VRNRISLHSRLLRCSNEVTKLIRGGRDRKRSARLSALSSHPHDYASPLALLPPQQSISVVIEPGASLVRARLRASLDGLDEGEASINKGPTQ